METKSNSIDFCNDHPIETKVIDLVQSLIFNSEREEIIKIYSSFKNVYNKKLRIDDKQYLSLVLKGVSKRLFTNYAISDNDKYIGVDFPVWFNFSENKPKIMLVGIDPLRTEKSLRDVISVGTPYNLHGLQWNTDKLEKNRFWNLISKLAETYSIYITDTFKVFFQEGGSMAKRSYNCKRFTNPPAANWKEEIHQKIFEKEVEIINPIAIITLGKKPVQWFTSLKTETFKEISEMVQLKDDRLLRNGIPVLPFPHLSGRSTTAGELYGNANTSDLPGEYISIINNYLKS